VATIGSNATHVETGRTLRFRLAWLEPVTHVTRYVAFYAAKPAVRSLGTGRSGRRSTRPRGRQAAPPRPAGGVSSPAAYDAGMVRVPHPSYCPHGCIVGWHYRNAPDVIVSDRMTAPCSQCARNGARSTYGINGEKP